MNPFVGRTLLNRYLVETALGRGGMAEVYKVWDSERAAYLALKLLHEDLAQDPVFLNRFHREANNLARLQHPNIVRFYGLEQDDLLAFILMDFVDGSTLRAEIMRSRNNEQGIGFPIERMLEVMRPVCAALSYAHHQNIIHCDVKPANIMLHKNGTVLVSDFGIARMAEAGTTTMVGAGTPAYMAPEQVRGHDPRPEMDIYGLGVVLYEMLTGGERPFTGEKAGITGSTSEKVLWEQINLTPVSPRQYNPEISPALEALVLRCLSKDPRLRYHSTLELVQTLEMTVQTGQKPEAATFILPPVETLPQPSAGALPQPAAEALSQPAAEALPLPGVEAQPQSAQTAVLKPVEIPPSPPVSPALDSAPFQPTSSALLMQLRQRRGVLFVLGAAAVIVLALAAFLVFGLPGGQKEPSTAGALVSPSLPLPTEFAILSGPNPPTCTDAGLGWESPADGMALVCVPVGDFKMGSTLYESNEGPVHTVYLDAFWIDRTEVTNAQFTRFVEATGYRTQAEMDANESTWRSPQGGGSDLVGLDDHPVVQVSWDDAQAYCEWAGRQLPSEAEWEKAARGTDEATFPWGEILANSSLLNFDGTADGYERSAPVGSFPRGSSPYGALDMAGNAREWVFDWYASAYPTSELEINPSGPASGGERVLRGGSWFNSASNVRATKREFLNPLDQDEYTGFRCVYVP